MKSMSEEKVKKTEKELLEKRNLILWGQNKKVDYYIEIALILILGILIGIAVKTEAVKRITVGFNDYQVKIGSNIYNINQLQADYMAKLKEKIEQQKIQQPPTENQPTETPPAENPAGAGQ